MNLSADKYDWLTANFPSVDEVRFLNDGLGTWWLLDNFTYNETAGVPEPASLIVWSSLGVGGIGLAAWRRRKT